MWGKVRKKKHKILNFHVHFKKYTTKTEFVKLYMARWASVFRFTLSPGLDYFSQDKTTRFIIFINLIM